MGWRLPLSFLMVVFARVFWASFFEKGGLVFLWVGRWGGRFAFVFEWVWEERGIMYMCG